MQGVYTSFLINRLFNFILNHLRYNDISNWFSSILYSQIMAENLADVEREQRKKQWDSWNKQREVSRNLESIG
jgi:hypothetical protein